MWCQGVLSECYFLSFPVSSGVDRRTPMLGKADTQRLRPGMLKLGAGEG